MYASAIWGPWYHLSWLVQMCQAKLKMNPVLRKKYQLPSVATNPNQPLLQNKTTICLMQLRQWIRAFEALSHWLLHILARAILPCQELSTLSLFGALILKPFKLFFLSTTSYPHKTEHKKLTVPCPQNSNWRSLFVLLFFFLPVSLYRNICLSQPLNPARF